ncbi:MAG: M23 family metallopeptidase, partial [Calditrichia bacterium]
MSLEKLEIQFLPNPNVIYKVDDDLGFENVNFGLSTSGKLTIEQVDSLRLVFYSQSNKQLTQSYPQSLLQHYVRRNADNFILHNFHHLFPRPCDIDRLVISLFTNNHSVLQDTISLVKYQQSNSYRLPFNSTWFVSSGHDFGVEHRRHLSRGHFAWDFVRINHIGKSATGNSLDSYFSYGQVVLAPADGVVIAIHDGETDNAPGRIESKKPNFIEIDHGGNEISRLVHLKMGSIIVATGDTVKSGQPIAKVGNSGYSERPHLHIGFQQYIPDKNGETLAVPIAVQFSNYQVSWNQGVDQPVSSGRPRRGQFLRTVSGER